MSKEHVWSAPKVECVKDFEISPIPICNIHWKLTTKNTENYVYTSIHNGYVEVSISPEELIALTQEEALTLLLSTLGNRVYSIENENSTNLDQMIFPVIPVVQI